MKITFAPVTRLDRTRKGRVFTDRNCLACPVSNISRPCGHSLDALFRLLNGCRRLVNRFRLYHQVHVRCTGRRQSVCNAKKMKKLLAS